MRRYTFPAFKTAPTLRYVVLWDLHWQLLEVQRLDPAADLGGAMAAAIARLKGDGWQAEAMPEYGFVLPTLSATDVRGCLRNPHRMQNSGIIGQKPPKPTWPGVRERHIICHLLIAWGSVEVRQIRHINAPAEAERSVRSAGQNTSAIAREGTPRNDGAVAQSSSRAPVSG
jgi:hypothetical protein